MDSDIDVAAVIRDLGRREKMAVLDAVAEIEFKELRTEALRLARATSALIRTAGPESAFAPTAAARVVQAVRWWDGIQWRGGGAGCWRRALA